MFIRSLLWIGFVSRDRGNGKIAWPFRIPSRHAICYHWWHDRAPYCFKNLPGVVKWKKGRLLPRRWGGGWLGFEFGDRGH